MFHHRNILAHAPFSAADVPADGLFNTGTFRHRVFLARGIFGTRNFRHLNISAQGYFGTWTFRHMDILAPCKAIWTFRHRHFGTCATVPKCPCAEMSLCQNVPVLKRSRAENSTCREVLMTKHSGVEMLTLCISQNVHSMERCLSCDETSVSNWLLLKYFMQKWSLGFYWSL